jgi:hypothetical protein
MKNAAFVDSPQASLSGEAYRLLLQVSLIGTELQEYSLAGGVAQTLAELRSDLPHAGVVLAMNDLAAGGGDQCVTRLEETLEKFPDSQLCRAMLGVSLQILGRSGWRGLLESVIEDGRDETAVALACSILGYTNAGVPAAAEDGCAATLAPAPANAMWV